MNDLAIKIEHVYKQYRLGLIGGGTLKGDIQSLFARMRGKEDPNVKIGVDQAKIGERFLALNDVSFEVKKGEALGIIGHNGAGKSTLLKLLSRVTAPTKGKISFNGRITSMLEVGTGFHGELTGIENIYMNGAILGMTKAEITKRLDQIIEFSELRKFIDTPVKRYSSGMYVKLGFSVASHLDSEIMIMDEVLAVGDVNFQQKCLKKMREAASYDGRTVLYVSHNMSTIRQLCNECVVLDHGRVVFRGDTEKAIEIYSRINETWGSDLLIDTREIKRIPGCLLESCIDEVKLDKSSVLSDEGLSFSTKISSKRDMKECFVRFIVYRSDGVPVGVSYSEKFSLKEGQSNFKFNVDVSPLSGGKYCLDVILCEFEDGIQKRHDVLQKMVKFSIEDEKNLYGVRWFKSWGNVLFQETKVKEITA